MSSPSFPEPLESRIAPATFISAREVQYLDSDGDLVRVRTSPPVLHNDFREFFFVPDGVGERLQLLQLDDAPRGTNVSITTEQIGGDGFVRVVSIEAQTDLGNVTVDGTLGRIQVGDSHPGNAAIQRLTVAQLGGLAGAAGDTVIRGNAAALVVADDVLEANVTIAGSLLSLRVGGSIVGGLAAGSGSLEIAGDLVVANVGDSLIGGGGLESGTIFANRLPAASIRGSIIGGSGDGSGQLSAGRMGQVAIGGDVVGGSALEAQAARHHGSGMIFSERGLVGVGIAGSVIGGSGPASGAVISGGGLGRIEIQGDLLGGSAMRTGIIRAQGDLGTVIIHGSVTGADGWESASIRAGEVALQLGGFFERSIFRLEIGGDLQAGDGELSGFVEAPRTLGSFDIGGSIIGGSARGGLIGATNLGHGHVGGDVRGGGENNSGAIVGGTAGSIVIEGGLVAGTADFNGSIGFNRIATLIIRGDVSGPISAGSRLGFLEIGGSLVANDQPVSARIDSASIGAVHIHGSIRNVYTTYFNGPYISGGFYVGRIGSLIVDGGISARDIDDTQPAITSYAVLASGRVGVIKVGGVLEGTASNHIGLAAGALRVAGGSYGHEPTPSAAGFGRIDIGGSARYAEINAGNAMTEPVFNGLSSGLNPDARIASIVFRGGVSATTVSVGAEPGPDHQFGTNDDSITPSDASLDGPSLSSIGSVVIVGRVAGTATPGDQFAIQAQRIGFALINGVRLPLTAGLDRFELAPATGDVVLRELSA